MKPRFVLGMVLLLAPSLSFGQARPEFGASVAVAYVDVYVSDREKPVRGLRGEDFDLRDNGVPQRVEVVETDALPIQVLLIFDSSNSLTGEKRAALLQASDLLLGALRSVDEVGVIAFSDEIRWLARPGLDRAATRRAIASLEPVGGSAVYDALLAALAVADPRGRTLVLLLTDEADNASLLDASHLRAVAERSSAIVHLVTVRPPRPFHPYARVEPRAHSFESLAELTGGQAWVATSTARLTEAFTRIAASLATRYVLRYEPKDEPKPGWHRLEVKLSKSKARIQTRRGYWVPSN
jgi:VWFA-related protein